jgi:hypothetical protein
VPPASSGPVTKGVLKRRDVNDHSKSNRHIGFSDISSTVEASPTFAIHSSAPTVRCS